MSPLLGISFCVSIQFATLESLKRYFHAQNAIHQRATSPLTSSSSPIPSHLSLLQLYVCGGVAGVANSFVSGPVEHIRLNVIASVNDVYVQV